MTTEKYEKVESFKYLGAMITSLNDVDTEIKSKIAVGNKCYYALGTILTLRRLMSYIYGAPILDVSRSHTTTQHSR